MDWVKAKAECIIDALFEGRLFAQIEKDVASANAFVSKPDDRSPLHFKATKHTLTTSLSLKLPRLTREPSRIYRLSGLFCRSQTR